MVLTTRPSLPKDLSSSCCCAKEKWHPLPCKDERVFPPHQANGSSISKLSRVPDVTLHPKVNNKPDWAPPSPKAEWRPLSPLLEQEENRGGKEDQRWALCHRPRVARAPEGVLIGFPGASSRFWLMGEDWGPFRDNGKNTEAPHLNQLRCCNKTLQARQHNTHFSEL